MSRKTFIWIGLAIGSGIGGFLPLLWGGSIAGLASVFLTAVGGFVGIYCGYRLSQYF